MTRMNSWRSDLERVTAGSQLSVVNERCGPDCPTGHMRGPLSDAPRRTLPPCATSLLRVPLPERTAHHGVLSSTVRGVRKVLPCTDYLDMRRVPSGVNALEIQEGPSDEDLWNTVGAHSSGTDAEQI